MEGGCGVRKFHKFLLSCITPCKAGNIGLKRLLRGDVHGDRRDGGDFLGLVVFCADGVVNCGVDFSE